MCSIFSQVLDGQVIVGRNFDWIQLGVTFDIFAFKSELSKVNFMMEYPKQTRSC